MGHAPANYEPVDDVFESHAVATVASPETAVGRRVRLPSGRDAVITEISPGKFLAVASPEDVPLYGTVRLARQSDGRYTPVLTSHSDLIQLTKTTPTELGLRDVHWRQLRRLVKSGIVGGCFLTPHVCLMSLSSLHRHMREATEQDFWTDARKEQFRTAN